MADRNESKPPSWTHEVKRIIALGVPIGMSALTEPVLTMTDTFVAGQIGTAELGAMGLAGTLVGSISWMFFFLTAWSTTAVARAFGRNDMRTANRATIYALVVSQIIALGLVMLYWFGGGLLIHLTGAVDALQPLAVDYVRLRAFGMPFLMISFVWWGAYRGVNANVPVLIVSIAIAILNLPISMGLALGLGWGLKGVAIGTDIVECIESLLLITYAYRYLGVRIPRKSKWYPSRLELKSMLGSVSNLFVRSLFLAGQYMVMAAVAGRLGVVAAAAHQILMQVRTIQNVILDSFAHASQALVAQSLDTATVRERRVLMRTASGLGAVFGLVLIPVMMLVRYPLIGLFTTDPAVVALTALVWIVPVFSAAFDGLTFVGDGIVMGYERWKVLTASAIIGCSIAIGVGLVVVSAQAHLIVLWIAVEVAIVIRGIVLWVGMRMADKKEAQQIDPS
ncbi:MATE family efflux transporter [Stomatohabitans albus]|uniref:MATE family efflux transporter n=1 Tax=Stomatohabitans albus TaxID=3110766 RepID=UPI00300CABAC